MIYGELSKVVSEHPFYDFGTDAGKYRQKTKALLRGDYNMFCSLKTGHTGINALRELTSVFVGVIIDKESQCL